MANTINATHARRMLGRLEGILSNIQRYSCILIGCIFFGVVYAGLSTSYTGAYPVLGTIERLELFLPSSGCDASPSKGYPKHLILRYPFTVYSTGWREVLRESKEHSTSNPTRTQNHISESESIYLKGLTYENDFKLSDVCSILAAGHANVLSFLK